MRISADGTSHEVMAALLILEDFSPNIMKLIMTSSDPSAERFSTLGKYCERHIQLDTEEHGPMGNFMLERLCGNSE